MNTLVQPQPPQGPDIYEQIAMALDENGWCVTPNFLSPLLVAQLRHELRCQWQEGEFRQAGVGRGDSFEINRAIRTDQVKWLDGQFSGAQKHYLACVEQLRLTLNRVLLLGLFDFERQLLQKAS